MRIVLLLLLFQFMAPAFLPMMPLEVEGGNQNSTSYHPVHNSVLIPVVLKEKEEDEHEDAMLNFVPIQLIDFTDHTLALTQLHKSRYNPVLYGHLFDHQPPLFALHCTFII